jgi:hypothetical protein
MYADFDKFNAFREDADRMRVQAVGRRGLPSAVLSEVRHRTRKLRRQTHWIDVPLDKSRRDVEPGRWYHAGIDRTGNTLKELGWEVVDADIGVVPRDPIVHFRKPG